MTRELAVRVLTSYHRGTPWGHSICPVISVQGEYPPRALTSCAPIDDLRAFSVMFLVLKMLCLCPADPVHHRPGAVCRSTISVTVADDGRSAPETYFSHKRVFCRSEGSMSL